MYLLDHTNNLGMWATPAGICCTAMGCSPGSLIVVVQHVGLSWVGLGEIRKELPVVTVMSEMCRGVLEIIRELWKVRKNAIYYYIRACNWDSVCEARFLLVRLC